MDINTSIGVYDAFSEPLRNMTNALNMTISSFETMQDVSSNAVNIQGLQHARDELAKAEIAFTDIGNEINQSSENQKKFNNEINNANDSAGKLYSTFKKIATVIGVTKLFKDGFEMYREFNLEMANLEAVTLATREEMEALHYTAKMMGETTIFSASQSASAMTELAKGGLKARDIISSIPDVLSLSAASGMDLARSAGITVDIMDGFNLKADQMGRVVDLIAYTSSNATTSVELMGETFGYSAKIADTFNASIEETAALIGLMSSAAKGSKAGTALRAGFGRMADPTSDAENWAKALNVNFTDPVTNELRSVTNIVDDLAVAFTRLTDAQQIQAAKAIFGEQGYNAWLAVIQEGQGAMDEWLTAFDESAVGTADKMKEIMLNTTDGIIQLHKSEVESLWITFYEGLADGVVNEAFQSVLGAMRTILEIGLNLATGAFVVVGHGIQLIADNLDLIIPIILTYAGVWAILNAELIINTGATLVNMGQQALYYAQTVITTIGLMLQATATFFLTWATQGLNAALMATPLGWVIGGIMIIIGAIYLAVAAFNKWAGTSISATGIIVGALSVAGAFIYNLVLALVNQVWGMGARIYNATLSLAEFFANVFTQPVSAIGNLFADLGQYILDIMLTIASTLDKVFGSNLSDAVRGWKSSLKDWSNSTFEKKKVEFERVDVESPFERIEYGKAWESGYNFGENLGQGMKDMLKFDKPELGDNFDFGMDDLELGLNGPGGITDMLGDIGKDTKGIKDKMKVSDEDIKYLRDLAANTIMSRLTKNDFTVQITNHNNIDSQLDLDGVVNSMADGLEEQLNIAMEGGL